ncbi:MAG: peroxidase [Planctomycetaceae bacterium]|jgi:uncharacterized peroxidase-related enzyme|nr:peroxidase [Planctomycetaceae bacterium]MBT6156785.1 peroxidase [Planctomycetaceae bacterium]MBT6487740.1 peroxidase [Planctomycetaceae bacterium]MBT6493545.1 peroxidase [Planctomycetaceae bacterium]
MAWIDIITPDKATGLLKSLYDAAVNRAGHVAHVVRLMSINPPVMRSSMALYIDIMHKPSALSRAQREMIATVVSRANDCFY